MNPLVPRSAVRRKKTPTFFHAIYVLFWSDDFLSVVYGSIQLYARTVD